MNNISIQSIKTSFNEYLNYLNNELTLIRNERRLRLKILETIYENVQELHYKYNEEDKKKQVIKELTHPKVFKRFYNIFIPWYFFQSNLIVLVCLRNEKTFRTRYLPLISKNKINKIISV